MPSLYAEIDIEAPKSAVWQALIHKDYWVEWNTFLFDCDPRASPNTSPQLVKMQLLYN